MSTFPEFRHTYRQAHIHTVCFVKWSFSVEGCLVFLTAAFYTLSWSLNHFAIQCPIICSSWSLSIPFYSHLAHSHALSSLPPPLSPPPSHSPIINPHSSWHSPRAQPQLACNWPVPKSLWSKLVDPKLSSLPLSQMLQGPWGYKEVNRNLKATIVNTETGFGPVHLSLQRERERMLALCAISTGTISVFHLMFIPRLYLLVFSLSGQCPPANLLQSLPCLFRSGNEMHMKMNVMKDNVFKTPSSLDKGQYALVGPSGSD